MKIYLVAELARVLLLRNVIHLLEISIFLRAELMRDLYSFQPLASWISLYFKIVSKQQQAVTLSTMSLIILLSVSIKSSQSSLKSVRLGFLFEARKECH